MPSASASYAGSRVRQPPSAAASGCASHRFVRDQDAIVNSRVDGVEQLTRYLELMNRDPLLSPVTGVFAAQINHLDTLRLILGPRRRSRPR